MPVKGDFNKLRSWQKLFARSVIIVEAQSQAMAECMISLVKEGYRRERNPYGEKWKPKKKPDGRLTLAGPTGRLKSGWHVRMYSRTKFGAAPSVEYAAYHQDPRRGRRPKRMQVPSVQRGLPKAWEREFKAIALAVAQMYFGGGQRSRTMRGLANAAYRRTLSRP